LRVFAVYGRRCHWCALEGRDTPATTVDHVVRRRDGGADTIENLRPACRDCNLARG
jgi:5-methylcytosine-specific restriction endonuclease McrA